MSDYNVKFLKQSHLSEIGGLDDDNPWDSTKITVEVKKKENVGVVVLCALTEKVFGYAIYSKDACFKFVGLNNIAKEAMYNYIINNKKVSTKVFIVPETDLTNLNFFKSKKTVSKLVKKYYTNIDGVRFQDGEK